jgi:hypothetical protein
MQCAVRSVQYAVCSVQYAVCSVQCAVCSVQCAVCSDSLTSPPPIFLTVGTSKSKACVIGSGSYSTLLYSSLLWTTPMNLPYRTRPYSIGALTQLGFGSCSAQHVLRSRQNLSRFCFFFAQTQIIGPDWHTVGGKPQKKHTHKECDYIALRTVLRCQYLRTERS